MYPRRIAAQAMHDPGNFKIQPDFDFCWVSAWIQAQNHARVIAVTTRKKLSAFRSDVEIPFIPAEKCGEFRKIVSIFHLGLYV